MQEAGAGRNSVHNKLGSMDSDKALQSMMVTGDQQQQVDTPN